MLLVATENGTQIIMARLVIHYLCPVTATNLCYSHSGDLPRGMYVWAVRYKSAHEEDHTVKGSVMVGR